MRESKERKEKKFEEENGKFLHQKSSLEVGSIFWSAMRQFR